MRQEGKLAFKRCRALLDGLLGRLRAVVGEDLLAVALFGPVARGEGGRTSDLDSALLSTTKRSTARLGRGKRWLMRSCDTIRRRGGLRPCQC